MLRWRLLLGTLIIAALVGLCWLDANAAVPGIWLLPVVVAGHRVGHPGSARSAGRRRHAADAGGGPSDKPLSWSVPLGVPSVACGFPPRSWTCTSWPTCRCPCWRSSSPRCVRYRQPGKSTANLAGGFLAIVYVGMMLQLAVWFRLVWGVGALATWIIVVKMGDTGAYAVGRLIGTPQDGPADQPRQDDRRRRRRALVFACLASWLMFCSRAATSSNPGPWWGWIAFGLLVGTAGMVGDLAESLLKRDVGRKDSSAWLPGFGGVLDILDSLLLSAPVAWFCWASGLVGH